MRNRDADRPKDSVEVRDEGSVLLLVLVLMVIGSLIVLPLLTYTSSVFMAADVQQDKARSIELARGGTWVALNHEADLFDMCSGGSLPSSLSGVSTTCQVVDVARRRDATEVPYEVAVLQADASVPASLASSGIYPNPNSTAIDPTGWDDWADTPDWTFDSQQNKVWLPQLPVRATSSGGTRDTTMLPGAQDPSYASCRVFFPGTFTTPLVISEPAYFTSGVYSFTEPITLTNGADVVVGNGGSIGCTTDFEAISFAQAVPDPLNMSGLGGTFVLGDRARIVIDDSGAGDIRFHMNQRYVSDDETSVAASDSVSIVAVNGTHAPLVDAEALGDDLVVDGQILMPASTVGTAGDPRAVDSGYLPSILTPKPTEPEAPTNLSATPYRTGSGDNDAAFTLTWDVPNDNGSLINSYVVTSSPGGFSCSPPTPTLPDTAVRPACTVTGLAHNTNYTFTVSAVNDVGSSAPSDPTTNKKARTKGGSLSPAIVVPSAPQNPQVVSVFGDGVEIAWDAPAADGGSPIIGYQARATDTVLGTVFTCDAWWNETSCVLTDGGDPLPAGLYAIEIVARVALGNPPVVSDGTPAVIDGDSLLPGDQPVLIGVGSGTAPVQTPATAATRIPDPIIDLSTTSTATVDVSIAGYVSVPQGHVRLDAAIPNAKSISMTGGIVAAQIRLDGGWPPDSIDLRFDNPISQKKIRIRSVSDNGYLATSDAVIQINRSGSLAINSWILQ